uniref:Uncharacterized protein n=1 Tax=Arundo donax TaxID=35708 RepID=A0A0A9BY97_ARUDO
MAAAGPGARSPRRRATCTRGCNHPRYPSAT